MSDKVFAQLWNWNLATKVLSPVALKRGAIVRVVGLQGRYQVVEPAGPEHLPDDLLVTMNPCPAGGTADVVPWYVHVGKLGDPVDTSRYEVGAPLYLWPGGEVNGKIANEGPVLVVARVLKVHETEGAIRYAPNAYGPARHIPRNRSEK